MVIVIDRCNAMLGDNVRRYRIEGALEVREEQSLVVMQIVHGSTQCVNSENNFQ